MLTVEFNWLSRRRDVLVRSISEMELHESKPWLDAALNPDITGCLAWAKRELVRVNASLHDCPPRAAFALHRVPHEALH